MVPNGRLRELVVDTARKVKVPLQLCTIAGGGTDGGKVHVHGVGVPSVFIGQPTRYIHSHASVLHAGDFDATVKLLLALLKRLDARTVRGLTR
jgi:putative aminopeptidase FrvX